jgi:hypothetical protein
MDVAIIWDIAPWIPYVDRPFGGVYHLHLRGRKSAEQETSVQNVATRSDYALIYLTRQQHSQKLHLRASKCLIAFTATNPIRCRRLYNLTELARRNSDSRRA